VSCGARPRRKRQRPLGSSGRSALRTNPATTPRHLTTLGDQPELFGQICSAAAAWRIVAQELPDDPRGIAALWSALARVREQAWALGAAPAGPLIPDVDATLLDAHADKQGAAPTYKQGFGFHPLGCWLDRGGWHRRGPCRDSSAWQRWRQRRNRDLPFWGFAANDGGPRP